MKSKVSNVNPFSSLGPQIAVFNHDLAQLQARDAAIVQEEPVWASTGNSHAQLMMNMGIEQFPGYGQSVLADIKSSPTATREALQPLATAIRNMITVDKKLSNDLMEPHPGIPLQKSKPGLAIAHDLSGLFQNDATIVKAQLEASVALHQYRFAPS